METREKKPYDAPALKVWGSLHDLTQSYFGNVDGQNGTVIIQSVRPGRPNVGKNWWAGWNRP